MTTVIQVVRDKLGNLITYLGVLSSKYDINLDVPEEVRKKLLAENDVLGLDPEKEGRIPESMIDVAKWLLEELSDTELLLKVIQITAFKNTPNTAIDHFTDHLHCRNGTKLELDSEDRERLCRYVLLFCELLK